MFDQTYVGRSFFQKCQTTDEEHEDACAGGTHTDKRFIDMGSRAHVRRATVRTPGLPRGMRGAATPTPIHTPVARIKSHGVCVETLPPPQFSLAIPPPFVL